ncbi:Protein of unknown function [Pyronema omphalodes CBS 100304]|uniref:Uncharacterized protein n=1 Tax=Pyronema omphalodes (strain CBS 100304) TaxID=1076935 RepID=U4L807_PYROM|nr:Protein of unknown function [Pyronema omphalodes CBS 100304]
MMALVKISTSNLESAHSSRPLATRTDNKVANS